MGAVADTSTSIPGRRWLFAVVAFCLSLAVGASCYAAAGVSLGLYFGPLLLMPFLAPALAMGQRTFASRLVVCIAITVGTWVIWLIVARIPLLDQLRAAAVLLAFVIALAGGASALEFLRLGPTFSAAFTTLAATAWLTWPVWLSHQLSGPHVDTIVYLLTFAHPLITLNGALYPRFDIWDRYTLTYQQLTTLNQDLIYTLPRSIAWMVAIHLGFGMGGLAVPAMLRGRRSGSRR